MSRTVGAHIPSDVAGKLDARFGSDWHFDVHLRNVVGGNLVVEGELKANGRTVNHSIAIADDPELAALSLGDMIESASARSLTGCLASYDSGQAPLAFTPDKFKNIDINPVTLRVIGGAFNTIAREMAHVLYRMSYSSIIRESEDLAAVGLFDAEGRRDVRERKFTDAHRFAAVLHPRFHEAAGRPGR